MWKPPKSSRLLIAGGLGVILLGGVLLSVVLVGAWSRIRGGSDPAVELPQPTASLAGTSLYVDERVCADCHATQASGHVRTGHADTFYKSNASSAARSLNGRTFQDPERGYVYRYHFDPEQGLSVSIPQQFGEDRFPLSYALGSGHNAITFLTLIPSRLGDTGGIEHRVSLYPGKQGWDLDLTPGHQGLTPRQDVDHFGRVTQGDVLNQCIACHTTTYELKRQELVNVRPQVGCQNCHGPGREHVLAVERGGTGGYSQFTGLSAVKEIQLCGRCHRVPDANAEQNVDPGNKRIVRFQSVGLLQSACFQKSGDTLKCSTCHDPHQPVVREAAQYVPRCLTCHGRPEARHCRISPETGCIDCHMPAIEVYRGLHFHDHWIRIREVEKKP